MMKKTGILLLILVMSLLAVAAQKKKKRIKKPVQYSITSIVLESFSRRGRDEMTVTADSIICLRRKDSKFILQQAQDWAAMQQLVKQLDLKKINSYEAPTKNREVDGASHCRIVINTKTGNYETQYFDCGRPMKPLQSLYDQLDQLKNVLFEKGATYPQ